MPKYISGTYYDPNFSIFRLVLSATEQRPWPPERPWGPKGPPRFAGARRMSV